MSIPRRLAVSYSRFSNIRQSRGDSEARQAEEFRTFCVRHNLVPVGEVYADRGRSGYKDEHRKKGRLGQLVAAARDGRFEPGTVIVVEAWDRLGRLRPEKQTALVAELLYTGVDIGVCRLDDIFTEEDFGTHKWTTLSVFVQLAFQESKQKGDRVARSWAARRERARQSGAPVGCPLPAWVEKINGEIRLIPERAEAVRRVFQLAAEGLGHSRIVAAMKAEKVEAPGRSGKWNAPYVALMLNDRRAVGEVQFRLTSGEQDGKPIAGYLPAVVTEKQYQLARQAQEAKLGTDRKKRAIVPRQVRYVNVFKYLLTHARDGEGMALHNHGRDGSRRLVLMNTAAIGSRGRLRTYTFPYDVFESAILSLLREVNPREILPRTEAPDRAAVLRATLANIRQDMAALHADLKGGYSKALAAVLREKEAEEEAAGKELQEVLARSVRPAERAWQDLPSLADRVREGGDTVRLALRPVLRRLIEGMHVLIVRRGAWRLCVVQVLFTEGGARRGYLVAYRPAGNGRQGGWWCCSLAHVLDPADLDLRKRDHAGQLESDLLKLDLEWLAGQLGAG
jgi:DNA invertase Pin-like site-specific DNA recombinase